MPANIDKRIVFNPKSIKINYHNARAPPHALRPFSLSAVCKTFAWFELSRGSNLDSDRLIAMILCLIARRVVVVFFECVKRVRGKGRGLLSRLSHCPRLFVAIGHLGQFGVRDKWARCVARDTIRWF